MHAKTEKQVVIFRYRYYETAKTLDVYKNEHIECKLKVCVLSIIYALL